MQNLGILYCNGQGIAVDYDKALELFKESYKKGNVNAVGCIGKMIISGQIKKEETE